MEIEARENLRTVEDANTRLDALYERLDDADVEILEDPVSTVIAKVCRALGIEPDWSLWHTDDWAQDEAEMWDEPGPYGRIPLPLRRIEPARNGRDPRGGRAQAP